MVNESMLAESVRGKAVNPPAGGDWPGRVEAWRQQLEACRQKTGRKRVHGLRVATLRLQAELERWTQEADAVDPARPAVARWMKKAAWLRDALKPVREADVHLGTLKELRETGGGGRQNAGQGAEPFRRQAKELARRLKRKREADAEELKNALEERNRRLVKLSRELETSLLPAMERRTRPSARDVRALVEAIAREHPVLSEENLHGYRKQMKAARYLAELSAETNAEMRQQAALLTRMQTVVGDWHDWQTLAECATEMLRKADLAAELIHLLETTAETKLSEGLIVCRQTTAELIRGSLSELGGAAPAKKPVAGAGTDTKSVARRAG